MTSLAQRTAAPVVSRTRKGGGRGEIPLAWGVTVLVLFAVLSVAVSLHAVVEGGIDVLRPMTESVALP